MDTENISQQERLEKIKELLAQTKLDIEATQEEMQQMLAQIEQFNAQYQSYAMQKELSPQNANDS